jgi:hypothetical protein
MTTPLRASEDTFFVNRSAWGPEQHGAKPVAPVLGLSNEGLTNEGLTNEKKQILHCAQDDIREA